MNSDILGTVFLLVFTTGGNVGSLFHFLRDYDNIPGISSLNILVSHPIYAGSHVLTLHTLRSSLVTI